MYIDGNRKRRQNVSRSLTRSSPSSTLQPLPSQIKARMHDPLRSAPSSFGRPVTCAFQVSIRHLLDPGPAIKLAASSGASHMQRASFGVAASCCSSGSPLVVGITGGAGKSWPRSFPDAEPSCGSGTSRLEKLRFSDSEECSESPSLAAVREGKGTTVVMRPLRQAAAPSSSLLCSQHGLVRGRRPVNGAG